MLKQSKIHVTRSTKYPCLKPKTTLKQAVWLTVSLFPFSKEEGGPAGWVRGWVGGRGCAGFIVLHGAGSVDTWLGPILLMYAHSHQLHIETYHHYVHAYKHLTTPSGNDTRLDNLLEEKVGGRWIFLWSSYNVTNLNPCGVMCTSG